jgi:hypothetical protein
MAVTCSGVGWCAAVRLFPLVDARQASKEDEETKMAIYLTFKI